MDNDSKREPAPWQESTCCVPMWQAGLPAGFCDKPAFGPQKPEKFYNPYYGFRDGYTGRPLVEWPYCHGHACPMHKGPQEGDPIIYQDGTENGRPMYCAVMPGFINLKESHAEFDVDPRKAVKRLLRKGHDHD